MDKNIFGITQEDLAREYEEESGYISANGLYISKEVLEAADKLASLPDETLYSLMLEGKEQEVTITAALPVFPVLVKAAAIFMGPYEFLTTYCMDFLPSEDEDGTSLADALAISFLLAMVFGKSTQDLNTRMLFKLFAGQYTYKDGSAGGVGDVDIGNLTITTQYKIFKGLQSPGMDRLFEIGEALLERKVFERLGIEFTEDNSLLNVLDVEENKEELPDKSE